MRISTMRGDPYYREDITNFVVLLDGELVRGSAVITADEEKGEVTCLLFDERGNICHDDQNILMRRFIGRVEIKPLSSYTSLKTA